MISVDSSNFSEKRYRLTNGMTLLLYPSNSPMTTVSLGVPFGSVHATLKGEDGSTIHLPFGTAHFLEHMVFRNPDGIDPFYHFSRIGADANAYTTAEETCFYFTTSDAPFEALDILLSTVMTPYFTKEDIRRERAIIREEIATYLDDPAACINAASLAALYPTHPVRLPIAGNMSSVGRITRSLLELVYDIVYRPSRMTLVVAGKYATEELYQRMTDRFDSISCIDMSPTASTLSIPCPAEERKPLKENVVIYGNCGLPSFVLGIRDKCLSSANEKRASAFAMAILRILFFSDGMPYSSILREEGGLVSSLSCEYEYGPGYAYLLIGGSARNPEKTIRRLQSLLNDTKRRLPSEEDFLIGRRVLYADTLYMRNTSYDLSDEALSHALDGESLSEMLRSIRGLSYSAFSEHVQRILSLPQSIVYQYQKEKSC